MRLVRDNLLDALQSAGSTELLNMFSERRYRKKEIVFFPSHNKDSVFIVKKGQVRVYLAFDDKEFTVSILEAGDVFSTHTRAFTEALDDCTLMVCNTEDFSQMLIDHPAFTHYLINVLGDLLKNCFTIIINLAFMEARTRLREYLLSEAEGKGVCCKEGIKVEIGQDLSQMATIIGVSRQTVSSLVNEFCRMGILERLNRKTILIKDRKALQNMDKQ